MTAAAAVRSLRLGARTSPLARAQVDLVASLLAAQGVASTFVGVTTQGDVDGRALTEIGGTGVFAGAVREALLRNEIDVAVHSLKDLPTADEPGLQTAAVTRREDPRDVLVGLSLDELDGGVRVGTGAPRRALQLQDWAERQGRRIEVVAVRGNVDTRLNLVRDQKVDAVVLAAAGLRRLSYLVEPAEGALVRGIPAEVLGLDIMLPAPGQGALALEVSRALAPELLAYVRTLDDPASHAEVLAERGFLARLEAGCTAPVGARAVVKSVRGTSHDLTLTAVVGRTLLENLTAPADAGPPLRLDVRGLTENPRNFGATHADWVLAQLQSSTPALD